MDATRKTRRYLSRGSLQLILLPVLAAAGCGTEQDDATDNVESVSSALASDSMSAFAAKCDKAIGVTVPAFNCDNGTEVPVTNFKVDGVSIPNPTYLNYKHRDGAGEHMICDRPNRLNSECDPGSKFQVLVNDNDAAVVAHCRKEGSDPGNYTDIAVIQWNKNTGATCFYQNNLTPKPGMSGAMPAPSGGTQSKWLSPNVNLAGDACVNCHDSGPIIRSP